MSTSASAAFDHQLHQLAHAYDVHAALDGIADAIIRRTSIAGGDTEREPVIAILALLLEHAGTLSAIVADQAALPDSLYNAIIAAARSNGPGMSTEELVGVVLSDISLCVRSLRDVTES